MESKAPKRLYIGLMSGTSMDAVDSILAEFAGNEAPTVLGWHSHEIPDSLRKDLTTLCTPGRDTIDLSVADLDLIDLLGRADQQLGELFAEATLALLESNAIAPQQITAIGGHGQTIRHRPPSKHQTQPFTLQIGDPNIIAARTGITTVADFRRADIAVGGQGAPLAPAFHKHVFSHTSKNRVIVNIGGMANITSLPAQGEATGFDTGPGNRLLDYWSQQHLRTPFDDKGHWAGEHKSNPTLLNLLRNHPFFSETPPKSTGRETFNEQWLNTQLGLHGHPLAPGDVQATLLALTVATIADAITALPDTVHEVSVCGGGAYNDELMENLKKALSPSTVTSTEALGIEPSQVEALAFAWLAQRTLAGQSGNLPAVTGARDEVVLGGIYPSNGGKH